MVLFPVSTCLRRCSLRLSLTLSRLVGLLGFDKNDGEITPHPRGFFTSLSIRQGCEIFDLSTEQVRGIGERRDLVTRIEEVAVVKEVSDITE